jgi:GT2 family glycosyltransferase
MTPPCVYIVTLNWNRCADTLAFLESCAQQSFPHFRMLVVDNGSSDGSLAAISTRFPHVEQIANGRNLGFAAGANVGLRHALKHGADYVFLANNDTTLATDALATLVAAAETHGAAIASPAIFYASAPERVWWLGGRRRPWLLEVMPLDAPGQEPFMVDFVTGCGMLISRRCLETVGLFDEQFFMYYEDSDYCLRVQHAGLRTLVVPRARMWHKVATSSGGSDSPSERYHMAASSARFFRKHARGRQWLAIVPYRAASAMRTLMRLASRRRWGAARAYVRGLWDGMRA